MKILCILITLFLAACADSANDKKAADTKTSDHGGHTIATDSAGSYCDSVNTGLIPEDTLKGSPGRTAMSTIHGTHVHIEYNSPGVKGRVIWGGLVPYGQVWVTGAHQATRVNFYKNVRIADTEIPKGTYAIFTIPDRSEWIFILNKNFEQHLADKYDAKDDVVRVRVKPMEHSFTARLTFEVEKLPGKDGAINVLWEKMKIVLPFKTM